MRVSRVLREAIHIVLVPGAQVRSHAEPQPGWRRAVPEQRAGGRVAPHVSAGREAVRHEQAAALHVLAALERAVVQVAQAARHDAEERGGAALFPLDMVLVPANTRGGGRRYL